MELSYLKTELINAYSDIREMYDSETYDFNKVSNIINDMDKPEPLPFHSSIMDNLQTLMNDERNMAINFKDNPAVRCYFGIKYLRHKLWNIIREDGIGSLLNFYIENSIFVAEIHFHLYLEKNEFEDEDSYEKRKEDFLKNIPYTYTKNKISKQLNILDNDKNRIILLSRLKELFSILRYEISSNDGSIRSIKLYCSDVFVLDKERDKINTEKGKVEFALSSLKECVTSINTCLDFPSLREHTISHVASSIYSVCVNLGICQEYIDSYEEINKSRRNLNKDTNDLIMEIGKNTPTSYIKDVFKKFSNSFYKYMENKYAIHSKICMDSNGISLDMSFSSSMLYESKSYLLDCLRESDIDDVYIISYAHMGDVKNILKRDLFIDINIIEIKNYQQYMYISSMKAFVTDILQIFAICDSK